MNREFYFKLADHSISGEALSKDTALKILTSNEIELLPLLNAAYEVRKKFTGKEVKIHIINNAQNGHCPEDCHYCAQAKSSDSDIAEYSLKSDDEFLAEAENAYKKGAYRYCMVFAGRGPNRRRVEHLANLIKKIKDKYPIQICVSAGLLDQKKADILKDAGLDRLNHNLNTSESNYSNICTTHTYADRLNTLKAGRQAGIQLCSGIIVGMNETYPDIVEVAYSLREMAVESIPVNFLIPIEGTLLENQPTQELTPEICLRTLCLFRFLNPKSEIRAAAGRELHLRNMEVLCLYPANSIFLDGYLNTKGNNRGKTLQMIKDSGFSVNSEYSVEELLENETTSIEKNSARADSVILKEIQDLRPALKSKTCQS